MNDKTTGQTDTLIKHADRPHSRYGGSTAKFWLNCTKWATLREAIVKEEAAKDQGEYVLEGTQAHALLEIAIKNLITHHRTGVKLLTSVTEDQDMDHVVMRCRDEIWEKVLLKNLVDKQFYIEVPLEEVPGLVGGPADFVVVYIDDRGRRVAHILDYKNGFVEVDPGSGQLDVYMMGLDRMMKKKGTPIDIFHGTIYQAKRPGDEIRTITRTQKQVQAFRKRALKQVATSESGKGRCKVGSHCTNCPNIGTSCTAYTKALEQDAKAPVLTSPNNLVVEQLGIETMIALYKSSDKIKKLLGKVEDFLHTRALKLGEPLDGLKVVSTKPRKTWADPENEYIQAEIEGLAKGKSVVKTVLRPIGEVTKLVPKEDRDQLDAYITMTKTSLKLVPIEDEREEETIGSSMLALPEGLLDGL